MGAQSYPLQTHEPGKRQNSDTETFRLDDHIQFCPPPNLMDLLVQQARKLKMLPDVAVKAIAIAENPEATVKELVNVVALDVKLTMNIIALANSTLFGYTQSVSSLQQAIMRLGFRQTKNMIVASSVVSMMQKITWEETRIRDLLCKHGLLTGLINSRLNTLFGLGLQGEEFSAGLIHDLGRTLLAVSLPNEFATFDSLNFDENDSLIEKEMDAIGTTHAEVGAWFLQRNHLPEELVVVARYHHAPHQSGRFKRLVALTAIADDMANFCHREESDGVYECTQAAHLELLETLGVEDAFDTLQEYASGVIESSIQEVNQLMK